MMRGLPRFVLLLGLVAACDYAFRLDEVPLPPDGALFSAWSAPRALAELNSGSLEADPSLTEDGLEIYFTSNRMDTLRSYVYRATRASIEDAFGEPVLVPELGGVASAGFVAGDGLRFYYNDNGDIFSVTRASRADAFGSPTREFELSSSVPDLNPRVSSDGLHATVAREVSPTNQDLFLYSRAAATDVWSEVRELTELNTPTRDAAAAFAGSELVIVFDSDRKTMNNRSDLYIATRATPSSRFVVEEIAALSTETSDEREPHLSADLSTLVFVRARDLYVSTRTVLGAR